MPSLSAYGLTWISLTLDVGYLFMVAPAKHSHCSLPWTWGITSGLLQRSTATAPYLEEGYLLTATPPDLQRGVAPLSLPAPVQPLLLGLGVASF